MTIMEKGTYHYTIGQSDIDFTGHAKHVSLIDYILQAAGDDASQKGFGIGDLNTGNISWVLMRIATEFVRRPSNGERITVNTWVNGVTRFGTTRNMEMLDAGGRVIAYAVTQWAVIDLETREAINLTERLDFGFALIDEPSPIPIPRKVAAVAPRDEVSRRIAYSDIDFNNHVNASCYLTWMFDMLPMECFSGMRLVRYDVNFVSEARYGDTVTTGCADDGNGGYTFSIARADGSPFCRGAMVWEQGAEDAAK